MIENNVAIIAAVSDNGVIGKNNKIPWHQKTDIRNFKYMTTGNIVVMGSKTFESLNEKPLSNRINFVLTSNIIKYNKQYNESILFLKSYDDALFYGFDIIKNKPNIKIFIIGGQKVYEQAINHSFTNEMFITKVHCNIEGDSYFPKIDESWTLMSVTNFPQDENNEYSYSFLYYKR
jgi:dihydrofolate reductase